MSVPHLKQAANGKWYVHWTDGRRSKRVSTGTKEVAAAKAFLAEWLTLEHSPGTTPGLRVADLWAVYETHHIKRHVVGKDALAFNWANLKGWFGHLTVDQIDQARADEYQRQREAGLIGRPARPATVRKELAALYAALNFCCQPKYGQNLFEPRALKIVRLPDASEPRDRWLTRAETERLRAAARQLRRGTRLSRGERFLALALETGARKQAILDLTWDRVDFEIGVVHYDVPGRKKTKKRRTTVPMSSTLRAVLEQAAAEREGDLVLDNKGAIWATIQHIVRAAGLAPPQKVGGGRKPKASGIGPHTFRHTFATLLARDGVPLFKIAKLLGDTIATVERTYAKHAPGDFRDVVERISGEAA